VGSFFVVWFWYCLKFIAMATVRSDSTFLVCERESVLRVMIDATLETQKDRFSVHGRISGIITCC